MANFAVRVRTLLVKMNKDGPNRSCFCFIFNRLVLAKLSGCVTAASTVDGTSPYGSRDIFVREAVILELRF